METISDVKIATVAVAYDCASTMSTYILFFHNVLYIPSMAVNLICRDQLREYGIPVNDIPLVRISPQERTIEHHSIIEPETCLHIPLEYNKPFLFFTVRKPSQNEINDPVNYVHVTLTSELEWNPYDSHMAEDEIMIRQSLQTVPLQGDYSISSLTHGSNVNMDRRLDALQSLSLALGRPSYLCALGDKTMATLAGVTSSGRSTNIDSAQLSIRWQCSLETTQRTLQQTTQRAIRDYTNIIGGRKLRATQYQLRYRRLHCEIYTNTYIGPCKSLLGNTCYQVYATKFQ